MPSVGKNHYTKQKGAKLRVTAQKHPQPVKKKAVNNSSDVSCILPTMLKTMHNKIIGCCE